MAYLELNDGDYTQLRKKLLKDKGSDLQKELLEATKDSESFIRWIEQSVRYKNEGKKFDLWSDQLSEAEYELPPGKVEEKLFTMWEALTPAQASRETFWGYVTLGHIKQGIIESSYLAARSPISGSERIDRALSADNEKPIDDVVRTILRSLSGLSQRGTRSVYVDCPFARAWWRSYVAFEVRKATGTDFDEIFTTLRGSSKGPWEVLIDLIVSQNSVLGDTKVRSALIWALSEREEIKPAKTLRRISKQIGVQSALRELGVFEVNELKEHIMEPTILRVLENVQKANEQKTKEKADTEHNEEQKSNPKSKPNRFKRILGRS